MLDADADGSTPIQSVVSAWDIGAAYLLTDDWQLGGRLAVAANGNSPGSTFVVELAGRF